MSSERYRYAIIGTGRPWKWEGATGFGMAHPHWEGFRDTGRVDLVGIADIREEAARQFLADEHIDTTVYTDFRTMLAEQKPEIVSICTWPHLHAELTIATAEAGVKAIHCEKPMATTWGDAKRMKAAAEANGTILTFNHQRRFLGPFQRAKEELAAGTIGELKRMEAQCGDMFDWGTHWLDMLFFFNNETPAEWVIGQIDSRADNIVFGAAMENQAICHFKCRNGVRGLLITGYEADLGTAIRLIGTEGVLEIGWDSPSLRLRAKGDTDWRVIETQEGIHGNIAINRACADLIHALDHPGYKPLLSVDHAIQHTEVIYATYESSRKRGRVDLPLEPEDSALIAMLEAGEIGPRLNRD
ncbi:MAG: putative dehydrogenase [Chthonomonadales bacterium]|nr:putative dehydrogenase [Chthonomonadales bacterium]